MKVISKHLPLLALALLVSSTQLRAEELPFKVGDVIEVIFSDKSMGKMKVLNIKGKWFVGDLPPFGDSQRLRWFNSDSFISISHPTQKE